MPVEVPAIVPPSAAVVAAPPCRQTDTMPPEALHLGDGVTSDNYYVIAEYLKSYPGSAENTRAVEQRQREAQQTSGVTALKPPSSNVVESEFSALLGAVARDNGGVGAAIFDRHGLKIGFDGVQLESMVLPESRRQAVSKIRSNDPPAKERYSCERLKQLAGKCDPAATRRISCWDLEALTRDCKAALTAYYRPVLDYDDDSAVLGISVLVVEETPACGESPAGR